MGDSIISSINNGLNSWKEKLVEKYNGENIKEMSSYDQPHKEYNGEMPSINDVIYFLNEILVIKKTQYYGDKTEKDVENVIARQLCEEYGPTNVHTQYSVGGFLGLKCDIDLFNSKCCGIELKLAKQIAGNSSAYERLIGQVVYYSKRCYKDRLIVLVVGTSKDYNTTLKEVQDFIEGLGVHFVFKEIL